MTEKLNCILVPSDFSEPALHALRYAGELARELNARLVLLYADPFVPPIDFSATVGGWDEESFELAKICAEEQLRIDAKANLDPAVSYDVVVRVAMPLAGILDQARESSAGLIVIGTHGRSGFRRLIIGSVTEAVMRYAEVPVIAVPPRGASKPSIKTVVCPVVYKAQCREALTFAAEVAPPDARFIIVSANPAEEAELRAWIPEAIAARCDVQTIGDEYAVNPIEDFAKSTQADLIVAAEPAIRTTADVLRGTFAARLLQHSECPVLTVNAPAAKVAALHASQEVPAVAHQ
jgi:nucleotide-binding universal stress UspA family protein